MASRRERRQRREAKASRRPADSTTAAYRSAEPLPVFDAVVSELGWPGSPAGTVWGRPAPGGVPADLTSPRRSTARNPQLARVIPADAVALIAAATEPTSSMEVIHG